MVTFLSESETTMKLGMKSCLVTGLSKNEFQFGPAVSFLNENPASQIPIHYLVWNRFSYCSHFPDERMET